MKATLTTLTLIFSAALFLPGCPPKPAPKTETIDYEHKLLPGQLALRKIIDPKEIPDFTPALRNTRNLASAIDYSINYLNKSSSQKYYPYGEISHDQALASLQAFKELLQSGGAPAQLNETIRQRFDVYISVGCDDKGLVRFTGYYTPIFAGSRTPTAQFRYPLYRLPADAQVTEQGTVAMLGKDRRTIEQGRLLAGGELVYVEDPFEVYIIQVQGSAKIRLPDGTEAIFGYAGNNGFEYKSIRQELIDDGKIAKGEGLQAMIAYFKIHPTEITKYTWKNPRFVFFAESTDPFPHGSLNEPVTAWRSIATDKSIFPRGCLAMVSTTLPWDNGEMPYHAFALDQDTGGGIRAAGRCDIYMGIGERAGRMAGRTVQDGKLYYLFLKSGQAAPAAPAAPAASGATPAAANGK